MPVTRRRGEKIEREAKEGKEERETEEAERLKNGRDTINGSARSTSRFSSISSWEILIFLCAFRLLNALSIGTFFQPDEYFQSLEPAWWIAFGKDSGAWITWEWTHRLRSSLHPYFFAVFFRLADLMSQLLNLSPGTRADLLIVTPKILGALLAAITDFSTWKLGERIHGCGTSTSWASLVLSVINPWQWFCSTRTFSNCLETTLTVAALTLWPWNLEGNADGRGMREFGVVDPKLASKLPSTTSAEIYGKSLRRSLLLAALACILRPTDLLIWGCLGSFLAIRNPYKIHLLLRDAISCGALVILLGAIADHSFYDTWTFPPLQFFRFNISQSFANIYGRNVWHYYLLQGYPLLLTTLLPYAATGIGQSLASSRLNRSSLSPQSQLSMVVVLLPLALSLVSHKEVRFIYPILPILHVLASPPFASHYRGVLSTFLPADEDLGQTASATTKALFGLLLSVNIVIAIFTTNFHQPAPLVVLDFLRSEYETRYLNGTSPMTVGFLMPCHSTPWRSHLVHSSIHAWALGCDPPVGLDPSLRSQYLDEADRFYHDPALFLKTELVYLGETRLTPTAGAAGTWTSTASSKVSTTSSTGAGETAGGFDGMPGRKAWPKYLVFFETLEVVLREATVDGAYGEVRKCWNSWVHDDWRRAGDMVVWRLKE